MKAIFDRDCQLLGWFDSKNRNIYDTNIRWLGYVQDNYLFSKSTKWLGGFVNYTFIDKSGKPIAWCEGYSPRGSSPLSDPQQSYFPVIPSTPTRPLNPLIPLMPLMPLGGWSSVRWNDIFELNSY